jgi:nucleotide-binding universal stress UspA family protein
MHPHIIVVGVDFSELGDRAFGRAHELASLRPSAWIHAIYVASAATHPAHPDARQPTNPAGLAELAERLRDHVEGLLTSLEGFSNTGVRVVSHIRVGVPQRELSELAAELEADLIVVGSHGRHGIARWLLGSVAEGVVRHATRAVLIVPCEPSELPAAEVPEIEPTCPRCIEARATSVGQEHWCEQHRQRHGQRHTYHQRDRMSEDGSSPLVIR